jgi:hypothetical protein
MKKIIAALAVLIGIVAVGSAVSAEQLPFEHCTWTKASGRTVCSTVMPDGTIIPHRSIDGYALRAAVEAEERSLVWYERIDSVEDALDITVNPYAYEMVPAATPADHAIEGNAYLYGDMGMAL